MHRFKCNKLHNLEVNVLTVLFLNWKITVSILHVETKVKLNFRNQRTINVTITILKRIILKVLNLLQENI